MTEEVVTQEATAQFGQEAEDIAHTVDHGQAPQVLFSIKGSRDWKTRNRNSELGTGSGEGQFISLLFVVGLYGVPLEVSIILSSSWGAAQGSTLLSLSIPLASLVRNSSSPCPCFS